MGLLDCLLEVLAPTRCAGCDLPGTLLCAECRTSRAWVDAAGACPACGAPYGRLTCTECWDREYAFCGAVALSGLARPMSRCITLYKDGGERRLGAVLGTLLGEALLPVRREIEAVVPVPASPAAVRRRGFDHMLPVGAAVADVLGVPLVCALSAGAVQDQRRLGREARRVNAKGALSLVTGVPVPAAPILVDDVFTTGSTLDAATAVLLEAGAVQVRVGVLARAW